LGTIDKAVDQEIQRLVHDGDIPSLSVAIAVRDSLLWARSYNGRAGLDTVYMAGSITKPFVATAILQLYERGALDLDEDVSHYLPFAVRHPAYPEQAISVRTLLSHCSGLSEEAPPYWETYRFRGGEALTRFAPEMLGLELPYPRFDRRPSRQAFFEGLLTPGGAYATPGIWDAEPGTQYAYANVGYELLGYLVECIAGQSIEAYLWEHILEPLGMTHSGFGLDEWASVLARPYERVEGGELWMEGYRFPLPGRAQALVQGQNLELPLYEHVVGAGGLLVTVGDLAQFMIAHMNQGRAANGFQLLHPETMALMHSRAVSVEGAKGSFATDGYGLGWFVFKEGLQGHPGSMPGFTTLMICGETDQERCGFTLLKNHNTDLLGSSREQAWFESFGGPLERLVLQAAQEALHKQTG
jgi:CubicO group peptidase (beta-lactamase class C family)